MNKLGPATPQARNVGRQDPQGPRTEEEARLSVELKKWPDPEAVDARIRDARAYYQTHAEPSAPSAPKLLDRTDQVPKLKREADFAERSLPAGFRSLLRELEKGNENPGLGCKHLFGQVLEARARDGARVYFKRTAAGIEVLGKSTKANQAKVIETLRQHYGS